nr:MAG TPA: hypothetical protein [Caudoviricetes sp.]
MQFFRTGGVVTGKCERKVKKWSSHHTFPVTITFSRKLYLPCPKFLPSNQKIFLISPKFFQNKCLQILKLWYNILRPNRKGHYN